MKKLTALCMSMLLIFSLAACSNTSSNNNDSKTNSKSQVTDQGSDNNTTESSDLSDPTANTNGKTLIVYFSWSSNTEKMANTIA